MTRHPEVCILSSHKALIVAMATILAVQCSLFIMNGHLSIITEAEVKLDTIGSRHFVLCREVVLFQRLFCTECVSFVGRFVLAVLLSEVSLYNRRLTLVTSLYNKTLSSIE